MIEEIIVQCPACGEPVALDVDTTAGEEQSYFEDCAVCCRPIEIALRVGDDGELIDVSTQTDND